MTAATLTPSATAADLLEELRQLLGRHDGADTLDDVRELADELGTLLRRTRGRIKRLARQDRPAPEPVPETPAAEARAVTPETARPAPPPAPPPRPTFAAPLPPPRPVVIEIRPDKPAPDPTPATRPAETPPATPDRRGVLAVVGVVLTVLAVLWGAVARSVCRITRWVAAGARPYARRVRAAARRELDRWLG